MAKKTRKKSAAKGKKKKTHARASKKRKVAKKAVKRKAKPAARKRKPAAKPKGIIGAIVGAAAAVINTLTDADRLHHKLEPRVSRDPE